MLATHVKALICSCPATKMADCWSNNTISALACQLMQAFEACVQAEADRLIFEDADPETGFLMHPDLKWVSIIEI